MAKLYDKTGREIVVGDILKVFHFTAALRRKKHYMYKQAIGIFVLGKAKPEPFMKFSHLNMNDSEYYWEQCSGQILPHYEIVQSAGADFEDRPRRSIPAPHNLEKVE